MKICIDMDGVLCDFVGSANKRAKAIWGIELTEDDIGSYSYADTIRKAGVDLTKPEIYEKIMAPGLFNTLSPLPGAIEAIKQLVVEEHEITILTKALVRGYDSSSKSFECTCRTRKLEWLSKNLIDIPYSVIMVSDMRDKHLVNAHVLVDDDPRALEHPSSITICMAQPWNKKYRSSLKGMQTTIYNMSELPEKIRFVEKILRTRDDLEAGVFSQMEEEVGINESETIRSRDDSSSD